MSDLITMMAKLKSTLRLCYKCDFHLLILHRESHVFRNTHCIDTG
ncbi:hypothetical protein LINPERPRIM_LOCUS37042 [Linum perenne]